MIPLSDITIPMLWEVWLSDTLPGIIGHTTISQEEMVCFSLLGPGTVGQDLPPVDLYSLVSDSVGTDVPLGQPQLWPWTLI